MKKAIVYARFSPRPDAPECESVDKQIWDCRRWAKKNGYEINGEEYSDKALSGSDAERPGLWDAIYALKRGYTLLIRTWDRLARDSYLGEMIQMEVAKKGATIIAIEQSESSHNNPESKLVRTILLALAEYQRQITRARTRAAMRRHQAEGRRMSAQIPYGWKQDIKDAARIVPLDYEQAVVKRIIELKKEKLSLRGICAKLTEEHYRPRVGKRKFKGKVEAVKGIWHHQLIQGVITREKAAS